MRASLSLSHIRKCTLGSFLKSPAQKSHTLVGTHGTHARLSCEDPER